MKRIMFSVCSIVLVFALCISFNGSIYAMQLSTTILDLRGVMTDRLQAKLNVMSESDIVKVAVWIRDIDHESILEKAQALSKISQNDLNAVSNRSEVETFRKAKLDASVSAYNDNNADFYEQAIEEKCGGNIPKQHISYAYIKSKQVRYS